MPKPRGYVEISSSFYVLLLSKIWWDVCWVNEFVGSWVWIFPVGQVQYQEETVNAGVVSQNYDSGILLEYDIVV